MKEGTLIHILKDIERRIGGNLNKSYANTFNNV